MGSRSTSHQVNTYFLKIWRERYLEVHGSNPDEIELKTKQQYLIEIQHIKSINTNLYHSHHNWLLEDVDQLKLSSPKNLQTWIYGAHIISQNNQQQLKQRHHLNRCNQILHNNKTKPCDAPLEKSDLDPGE
jgi:hypothetical protein